MFNYSKFLNMNFSLMKMKIIYWIFNGLYKKSLIYKSFNLDNMSLLHLVLTLMLLYIMSKTSFMNILSLKFKKITVIFLFIFLLISFTSNNFFFFFIFFELSVIPMVMLIMVYGGKMERILSSSFLFLYTFMGSVPLLLQMVLLKYWNCKSSYLMVKYFSYESLYMGYFTLSVLGLFSLFSWLMGFLMKFPMLGFHYWLPKAHVEAPTMGSMMLAGILLKLGSYGFLRLEKFLKVSNFKVFTLDSLILKSFFFWLITSLLMSGLICFRQSDLKSLVAYSSMVHMGLMAVAFFNMTNLSLSGGLLMIYSHGIVSSGLFFMVGCLYFYSTSRSVLIKNNFLYKKTFLVFQLFMLASLKMAFPPFISFLGEFFLMNVILKILSLTLMFLLMKMFMTGLYNMILYTLMSHGKLCLNLKLMLENSFVGFQHMYLSLIPLLMMTLMM